MMRREVQSALLAVLYRYRRRVVRSWREVGLERDIVDAGDAYVLHLARRAGVSQSRGCESLCLLGGERYVQDR